MAPEEGKQSMIHALTSRPSIGALVLVMGLSATLLAAPAIADTVVQRPTLTDGSVPDTDRFEQSKAFAAWQKTHRWVRVGLRFHGYLPKADEHAALDVGAGVMIPVTTDLFMGLGVRVAFIGAWNPGAGCINRGGLGGSDECPNGYVGGVDYRWREPYLIDENGNESFVDENGNPAGRSANSLPHDTDWAQHRRESHVAQFALAIGGNYEVTLPHIRFFQIFQPFVGGGLLLMWVHTYSDIDVDEFVLINNPENDPGDPDNIDPWSKQGPEVGGEIYGGFHLNPNDVFRFVIEFGYENVLVRGPQPEDVVGSSALLQKATATFEASHLEYRLSQFRFGGGFEFKF
jgi:hypothetical protein